MRTWLTLLLLLAFSAGFAQKKVTLSGYVKDSETGEGMIAATVRVAGTTIGTTTNEYGFYSLSLAPGTYTIEWSFVGFATKSETLELKTDVVRNTEIGFDNTELEEVVVSAERADENVKSVQMSVAKLDIAQVKKLPSLMGEADIIRSIQLLPGVSTVGEGATGFNVRGGNIDQNLILLDESPVFSSSHLFGFFSVFNADAIKDVKLYKGGIPAKYGGRLSSVLDIRQIEGNSKRFSTTGGIGLLFSRLMIETPIVKDKLSVMVAGRRSYFDIFFPLANDPTIEDSKLFFYDLNGKINWTINNNNRLYLSGYFGDDVFDLNGLFNTRWGNRTGTLRWNHLFSEKVFANFSAIYSNYSYALGLEQDAFAFDWSANIENYLGKADFTYYANPNNTLEFGAQATYFNFAPGQASAYFTTDDQVDTFDFKVPEIPAMEAAAYISNEQKIGTRLTLSYGLRYSAFAQLGKGTVYKYPNDQPIDPESPGSTVEPIDSAVYDAGEIVKTFHGAEPRLALNFQLTEVSSMKASYNLMRQYIHLISNTTAATPVDIYMPAGEYIDPAVVHQVGLGYFQNFSNNMYELATEVYYKTFDGLVDYKDEAELLLNNTLETELYSGVGRGYGLELQLSKKRGDFNGWISYTLSRVERQVDAINAGEWYPANWDKTHTLSVVASYDLGKEWNFGATFNFMSGRPITYPEGRYTFGGITAPIYVNRNGARTPEYHRLDLSINAELQAIDRLTNNRFDADLSFGCFNVYGRKNPYSIYFQQDADNPQITNAYRLSIYAIPIPFVTANFKF